MGQVVSTNEETSYTGEGYIIPRQLLITNGEFELDNNGNYQLIFYRQGSRKYAISPPIKVVQVGENYDWNGAINQAIAGIANHQYKVVTGA